MEVLKTEGLDEKSQHLDPLWNKIEQQLELLGATAIEDKMQSGADKYAIECS